MNSKAVLMEFQQPLVARRWGGKNTCQQECRVRDFQQMTYLQKTPNVLCVSVQLARLGLARLLFVTRFKSDLSDFCHQSRSACSYFRNAPVKLCLKKKM